MNTRSFMRRWVSSWVLTCLWVTSAVSDASDDKIAPAVICPCASEYAAAVVAYNERGGAPLTEWRACEVEVSGVGGRIGYATKADPQPPNWVTVILVSKGRWGYGHGIARRCEAWTYQGLAGDWGRPPLGAPTHGGHEHLSEAEILACTDLIAATAKCPN